MYTKESEDLSIRRYWIAIIFVLTCFEICHSAKLTISQGVAFATEHSNQMERDTHGYYGDLADATKFITEYDKGLYRVVGAHPNTGAATYCSPQYFAINDSSYYIPIDAGTYRFLDELYPESFINGIGSKYSIGVGGDLTLSTITGYKYIILYNTNDTIYIPGYKVFAFVGDFVILENEYALSFGLTYDSYMTEADFLKYSNETQRKILFSCVVVEDEVAKNLPLEKEGRAQWESENWHETEYYTLAEERAEEQLMVESWKDDEIIGTVTVSSDKVLTISLPYVSGWKVYVDGEQAETFTTNLGFFGVLLEEGTHDITIKYTFPFLGLGIFVTVFAIVVYIILLVNRKKVSDTISRMVD